MGFGSSILKVRKYRTSLTWNQLQYISMYCEYSKNDWAKKHFNTPVAYANYCIPLEHEELPAQDAIDFYYNSTEEVLENIHYFGSWASGEIHSWLMDNGEKIFDKEGKQIIGIVALTPKIVKSFLDFCWEHCKSKFTRSGHINYAFRLMEKKEEEIDEDGDFVSEDRFSYKLIPCDGIELEDGEGKIQRIYTNEENGTAVTLLDFDCNDVYDMPYFDAIDAITQIFVKTDFSTEKLYYTGGW